jgi:hypothetical protein
VQVAEPLVSQRAVSGVQAELSAILDAVSPAFAESGARLLGRLAPPACTLEWGLAGWLGDAFGLPAGVADKLTLCNMLGLGYLWLLDDLADGDLPAADRLPAACLTTLLYEHALLNYAQLFAPESAFWAYMQEGLASWVRASLARHAAPAGPFTSDEAELLQRLAQRGAPRKICCAAACLLAERADLIGGLGKSLDHLMVASALLDDLHDWQADLAACRPNEFVAYASALPQTAEQRAANRSAVLQELLLGARGQPYFAVMAQHLARSLELAQGMGIAGLARYLEWYGGEVSRYCAEVAAEAGRALGSAGDALFGPPAGVEQGLANQEGV